MESVCTVRLCWRRLFFVSGYPFYIATGFVFMSPHNVGTPSGLDLFRTCACCHSLCEIIYSFSLLCLKTSLHYCILSPLLLQSFYFFFSFLSPEGRNLMKTMYLGLSVPKSLTLCTLPHHGFMYLSHLWQEKVSLMIDE